MPEFVLEQRRQGFGNWRFGRVLPSAACQMVGPFIFFDHMGPGLVGKELDIRPHPHIGLAAVTYTFAGNILHRDSVGSEQLIRPGEANWMTAGRGITHSERFTEPLSAGAPLHCIQGWVALPEQSEETEPSFDHYPAEHLPVTDGDGIWTRLIAGEAYGLRSAVKTHSPVLLAHHNVSEGKCLQMPAGYSERAAYIVSGLVEVRGARFEDGRMLVFGRDDSIEILAIKPTTLIVLGGEPVGKRFVEWNFVSSSRERIQQAKADWRARRMKLPDLDDREFIPLPREPAASMPPA